MITFKEWQELQENTYIILVKTGYDFEYEAEIEAKSPQEARKLFMANYKGPEWRIAGKRLKVQRKGDALQESFDNPYEINWFHKSDWEWRGSTFDRVGPAKTNIFRMRFTNMGDDAWSTDFDVGFSIYTTGGGDAQRIFATAISGVKEFLEEVNPKSLFFSANKSKGNSRVKLYKAMVQKFIDPSKYRVENFEASPGSEGFLLQRKE